MNLFFLSYFHHRSSPCVCQGKTVGLQEVAALADTALMRALTFGRGPGCDVIVSKTDPYMSPVNCRVVEIGPGRYLVQDMGSTNGTWIVRPSGGEVRVYSQTVLRRGDRVRIGRTVIALTA